jgi:hypothetical protein
MTLDAARKAAREHEMKLQRQMLDWIEVVRPQRGDILVMRVPDEQFIHPGTPRADVSEEQEATMETCHRVISEVIENVSRVGIQLGGAAIMAESMRLEDLPPPQPPIPVVKPRILLPPGTQV